MTTKIGITPPPFPIDLLTTDRDRQLTAKVEGVDRRVGEKRREARRRQWTADAMVAAMMGWMVYGMGCVCGWW